MAVLQDQITVSQTKYLVQPVRNERSPPHRVPSTADDLQESINIVAAKDRRRFVQDQDARLYVEGFGNFEHLLFRDAQSSHQPLCSKV